jgi:glutamate:GABA antiporter
VSTTATNRTVLRPKVLGVFALAMISVAAVLSLRNVSSMAEYGWESIFWILLGTVLFLLPLSFVGAELATSVPESTGVYDWVRAGEGEEPGFVAIWAEWVENVVWFPTVMSFVSATLAFVFVPGLAANKYWLFFTMVGIFWVITLVNTFGERWSSAISTFGVIVGTLVPALMLTALGIGWLATGHKSAAPIHGASSFFPHSWNLSALAMVATVILMFAGMEMAGFHALDMKNPRRDYPRASGIAAAIILAFTVLPTLAIAVVVPRAKISLVSGLVQAFQYFYSELHIGWMTRPTCALLFIGSVALVSTWVIGPAKGMQGPTRDRLLPEIWGRQNKHGVPVAVITLQAILMTIFSAAFLLVPGVNGAYWILSALTTEVLCIMYALIFTSVIRLRYTDPQRERPYQIPGGHIGLWVNAGGGLLAVSFAFILGFVPPSQITTISAGAYPIVMAAGTVLLIAPVFFFYHRRRQPVRATTSERPTRAPAAAHNR